jgi:hypothetical protein
MENGQSLQEMPSTMLYQQHQTRPFRVVCGGEWFPGNVVLELDLIGLNQQNSGLAA